MSVIIKTGLTRIYWFVIELGEMQKSFSPSFRRQLWVLLIALVLYVGVLFSSAADVGQDVCYSNHIVSDIPWSVHVVSVKRNSARFEVQTMHAGGGAIGFGPLSSQMELIDPSVGKPIAGLNGDFYIRERAYAGAPRGLQIMNGELIHGPAEGLSFWIDALGEPHLEKVISQFQVLWPDGKTNLFGVNEERMPETVVVYTPTIGASTKTEGGVELTLERINKGPWLPLKIGRTYSGRVKSINTTGDSMLVTGELVISIGSKAAKALGNYKTNDVIQFSTSTVDRMMGARMAISGGPALVREGKAQKIKPTSLGEYEYSTMLERHPRSAVGWNKQSYFLVEVDGRQKSLSVGMTLEELSNFMVKLGCDEAMNLDGGGSATFWYDGKVANSPCDGHERDVANCLVVIEKSNVSKERLKKKSNNND